ncbi:MAG: hypothetical protein Terrestrivirus1_211 [Terrestrivirus sp.]|uniref:Uncharacterized protein n=1 Tax=Terrestrivirus sp. TaxID=2487775 RepID=A0A3G4ZKH3_9VIRU|nr:MAG: hypothetical protein Terrestrivirus1_211 [Terrestrivirus sp.]
MVYRTYLVDKRINFQPPEPKIISLSDYIEGEEEGERSISIDENTVKLYFEYIVNFDDIFSYKDKIIGKSINEALANIDSTMNDLFGKGHTVGVPDPDNNSWIWGHTKEREKVIIPKIMDNNGRIAVALYWLNNLKELLISEKDKYDNNDDNYIFVTNEF